MSKEIEIPEGYEAKIEGNKIILEPKESDDERIRKCLSCLTSLDQSLDVIEDMGLTRQQLLTYLEKQKEQKPAECEGCAMYLSGNCIHPNGKCDKVKSKQEWSEEDVKMLENIICDLQYFRDCETDEESVSDYDDEINWLKDLPERLNLQPKQGWSEEDNEHIDSLLKRLDGMCKKGATFTQTRFAVSEDMDWLKDLYNNNKA